MNYTIDLDIIKDILRCPAILELSWRRSASRLGFHFTWTCLRDRCFTCWRTRLKYDDPVRVKFDKARPEKHRNILWDVKNGAKAGAWVTVKLPKWYIQKRARYVKKSLTGFTTERTIITVAGEGDNNVHRRNKDIPRKR